MSRNVPAIGIVTTTSVTILQQLLTSSIFVAKVGEPPDVAETHGHGDAGEQEVELAAEGAPLLVLVLAKAQ